MTFTVGDLLATDALGTRSLTPGVGERRAVEWAHVCELREPWQWIGDGALVMTTGLGVPADPAEQCAYVEGMHAAGIAAVTIGEAMSAPPVSQAMLAAAEKIGFPVLETAHALPFIKVAMAVAEANNRENVNRVRLTERLYGALRSRSGDADLAGLLEDLGGLLDARVTIESAGHGRHGQIDRVDDGVLETALVAPGDPRLRFTVHGTDVPDFSVLQHAAAIVGSLLAVRAAADRRDRLHGSLLLGDLLDASMGTASAERFLDPHRIRPPYVLAGWRGDGSVETFERTHAALHSRGIANLLTATDGLVVVLAEARAVDAVEVIDPATAPAGPIALSRAFERVEDVPEAFRQVRLVLSRTPATRAGMVRFEDARPGSLFLPEDPERLRDAVDRTLGGLFAYDRTRGTELVATLRVFLEENRSWVRASKRLFVHRQTLVSRVARIEEITGRSLSTTGGASELWHAVQAAVEIGDLPPSI